MWHTYHQLKSVCLFLDCCWVCLQESDLLVPCHRSLYLWAAGTHHHMTMCIYLLEYSVVERVKQFSHQETRKSLLHNDTVWLTWASQLTEFYKHKFQQILHIKSILPGIKCLLLFKVTLSCSWTNLNCGLC